MTLRHALTLAAALPFLWAAAAVVGTVVGVALTERNMRASSGAED